MASDDINWDPSDPTSAINAALWMMQKQAVTLHRIADHTATIAAALERLAFPPVTVREQPPDWDIDPEQFPEIKGLHTERLTGGYYPPGHRYQLARAADGIVWLHDHQDRKRYRIDPDSAIPI